MIDAIQGSRWVGRTDNAGRWSGSCIRHVVESSGLLRHANDSSDGIGTHHHPDFQEFALVRTETSAKWLTNLAQQLFLETA
jgi:hypothetical protein